jgi:hypothetical protein
MPSYAEPIGAGGLWLKEGKKGKFFSGQMTFGYNGHQVTATVIIFRNTRKQEGTKQPDYSIKVTDAFPTKPKENGGGKSKEGEDIPF